jgi:hypothetical protein
LDFVNNYNHIINLSRSFQLENYEKKVANQPTNISQFKINDLVMMKDLSPTKSKLHLDYIGPYKVINKSNRVYELSDLPNQSKIYFRDISHLRPYFGSNNITTITNNLNNNDNIQQNNNINTSNLNNSNNDTFLVEKILKEKILNGKKYYFIKWLNFDDSHNTWEPISNLKNNIVLQNYLSQNKSKK